MRGSRSYARDGVLPARGNTIPAGTGTSPIGESHRPVCTRLLPARGCLSPTRTGVRPTRTSDSPACTSDSPACTRSFPVRGGYLPVEGGCSPHGEGCIPAGGGLHPREVSARGPRHCATSGPRRLTARRRAGRGQGQPRRGSAGLWQTKNMPVPERPGEIYVNSKTCKRPVRCLYAPASPIDGWTAVGVPFLSVEARSGCGRRFGKGREHYQGRSNLGSG